MTDVTSFQRARSDEQRDARRQSILATAAAMLAEMPVSALSLNELSRRVGLAKSNVLRYFESREAVLLDLLDTMARHIGAEIAQQLTSCCDPADSPNERAEAAAAALAATFAGHETFCELLSAQAGVLEHNISVEVAVRYKKGTHESLANLASLLEQIIPELGGHRAAEAASMVIVLAGALWTHTHPADAVRSAYASDPSLIFIPESFEQALEHSISILLIGLLAGLGYFGGVWPASS
jgi:AcrR family transcriptional regulator